MQFLAFMVWSGIEGCCVYRQLEDHVGAHWNIWEVVRGPMKTYRVTRWWIVRFNWGQEVRSSY